MARPRTRLPAAERRPQILKAAVAVFARSNYRAATTADVAAEAGISEALIYKFFPSKKAIFLEILRHMSERIVSFWREEQEREPDALRALRNMATAYYTRMAAHPDELRVQFQAISEVSDRAIAGQLRRDHEAYMRSIGAVLERGIRQGTIRGDLDVTTLAFLFDGVGILMNMMQLLGLGRTFNQTRIAALVDHLLDALRTGAPAGTPGAGRPAAARRTRR